MGLIDKIDQDLKQALLARDQLRSGVLKSIKSAMQYAEVKGASKQELDDGQVQSVLQKESKKRQEAAEAYEKAGSAERRDQEIQEKAIIDSYLPEQLDDSRIEALVTEVISSKGLEPTQKNMGIIIKSVKERTGAGADGAKIAKIVKSKIVSKE